MSQCIGTVDVYDVAPTPQGSVRLSLVVRTAQFPDFAVDLSPATARRVGLALIANAETQESRVLPGAPAQGASHGT